MMRQNKREFDGVDAIYLVDKQRLKTRSLFSGNLVADRSNCAKGYGGTFPEFLASLKVGSAEPLPAGPLNVDLEFPAVTQIWRQAQMTIQHVNQHMIPLLKLLGVEEGNGLYPFAKDMETLSELLNVLEEFSSHQRGTRAIIVIQNVTRKRKM